MSKLTDRVDALERTCGAVSQAEIAKAMDMLAARMLAKLDGATELPPEPPAYVLAELGRYVTPGDIAEASAKLERLLARRAGDAAPWRG